MNTISLCLIVKNEETVLERCLNSVKDLVDEIVIVDTGSSDNTINIAKKFTSKVYSFKWQNDFSLARNYAFSLASGNYLMWLDADDVVPAKTITHLKKLKPFFNADVYMLKYCMQNGDGNITLEFYRERIIKNCKNAVWVGAVHECITPFGKVERLNLSILHKKIENKKQSNRNLNIYKTLAKKRKLTPREQYYFGRELFDHKLYNLCILTLNDFVNSKQGFKENVIDALFLLSLCYKQKNDSHNMLISLFKTFEYDTPRANACCLIGDYFYNNQNYNTAIFWYQTATKCSDPTIKGGFVNKIYFNYYPFLQLSCCYYFLNDIKMANSYNLKAEKFYKTKATESNKLLYQRLLNKE